MEKSKLDRINELAHKAKAEGLTAEETVERAKLRQEYIDAFKNNMRDTLESIRIQEDDGTLTPLNRKTKIHHDDHHHHHHDGSGHCSCGCHHHHEDDNHKIH